MLALKRPPPKGTYYTPDSPFAASPVMLENASRQFLLVLVAIIAGIACIATLDPTLGPDLKGGTQLLYNVPKDTIEGLVQKEGASAKDIMAQTITVMRERIDPNGTLDPLITQSGDTGILIEPQRAQAGARADRQPRPTRDADGGL